MSQYHVIGLLSGSSLDGADIAYCAFDIDLSDGLRVKSWELVQATTIPFTSTWIERLKKLPGATAKEFVLTDTDLGHYFGECIRDFVKKHQIKNIDLVSSHGHTIFHFPELRTTTQIGDGAAIVSEINIDTVTQLRSSDVAIRGQGAPLAPLGDRHLYAGYDLYLNLGGIANITATIHGKMVAFDITTCNQLLNGLANEVGKEYDEDGILASCGSVIPVLQSILHADEYHNWPFPKSLDNTWSQTKHVIPAKNFIGKTEDKLKTSIEVITTEIAHSVLQLQPKGSIFCTGGGALNKYLIKILEEKLPNFRIVVPDEKIVMFKEVTFIALAGLCRYLKSPNLFSTVTGASIDTINGALYSKQNISK